MPDLAEKSDERASSGLAKHSARSSAVGLSILALMTVGIHFAVDRIMRDHQDSAVTLNVAGRQRMLSQRIGLLATELRLGDPRAKTLLLEAVDLMERSQDALIHGGALGIRRAASPEILQYYFGGTAPLDSALRHFLATTRSFAEAPLAPTSDASYQELRSLPYSALLPALDHVATLFQQESDRSVQWMRNGERIVVALILLVLALEAKFIFWPAIQRIRHFENTLSRRDAQLTTMLMESAEANAWLQAAEKIATIGHWRVTLPDMGVTWSDEIYRIHGVTRETYTPDLQQAVNFYHPDDRERVEEAVGTAIAEKIAFDFQLRILRESGEIRHIHCRGMPTVGPEGEVTMLFGVFADITDQRNTETALREANKRLDELAYVDALTGMPNRRKFDEDLDREWRLAIRNGDKLSIAMLDVDHFKAYNDHYGHQAGDECLSAVAKAVSSVAKRPSDLIARYGGEEFVMLLPSTDAAGALLVAQKVQEALAALGVAHDKTSIAEGIVSLSIGIASMRATDVSEGFDAAALVAEADAMLYEAKRTGRNRIVSQAIVEQQKVAPLTPDEEARLFAVDFYAQVGATRRTGEMDRIVGMAAKLMETPIALVSIVDKDEQVFAGNFGLEGVDRTGRDVSFCAHTILGDAPMIIHDASADPRFLDNALVTGDLGIRYYAGAPIVSKSTGHALGALCVIDTQARKTTSPARRALIADLADMAATLIEEKADAACDSGTARPPVKGAGRFKLIKSRRKQPKSA